MNILLLMLFVISSSALYSQRGNVGFIQVDFLGAESPLYLNNTYSNLLKVKNGRSTYANIKAILYYNKKRSNGIGLSIYNYQHTFDIELLRKEIINKGEVVYGDMWLHNFSEWRFGIDFYFSKQIRDKHLISIDISSGIALSSRGTPVLLYTPNNFIYPEWKLGYGGYIDYEINYFYTVSENYHNFRIGLGFEMGYGNIKTEYEVRYGTGLNNYDIYDSYNYKHNYIFWRYGFSLKARIDMSAFHD